MNLQDTVDQLALQAEHIRPSHCQTVLSVIVDERDALSAEERAVMELWALSRQREFASGRVCARRALSALGIQATSLLPDAEGVPLWPDQALGSITHSRGIVLAAVVPAGNLSGLGFDLEKTNRLREAAIKRVVHPLEAEFVQGEQARASILFSLKEAFYKAQFPTCRTHGNFHDLALKIDLDRGQGEVLNLAPRFDPGLASARFAFRVVDDYVVSCCWF